MAKKSDKLTKELNSTVLTALMQLRKLADPELSGEGYLMDVVQTFLLGMMSTAVDMVELSVPGSGPHIFASVEAAAKAGGLRAIKNAQSFKGAIPEYSVSNIAPDDAVTAMNYIGQELGTTLFKALYELPVSLQTREMPLRGVEALLGNLLNQKFGGQAHDVLDSFCEHVHMVLDDLASRRH